MSKLIDLTGNTYGLWFVLRRTENSKYKSRRWICKCNGCQQEVVVLGQNLVRGKSKGCRACVARLAYGIASFNGLYNSYLKGAKKRNYNFELSKDEFKLLTGQNCYYCGATPSNTWRRGETHGFYKYNGIDRSDNDLGYTVENSRSCCGLCNRIKWKTSEKEFLNWVSKVAKHHNLLGENK